MTKGIDWEQWLLWASVFSVLMALVSLVAVPWVVARLPADYFSHERRETWRGRGNEPLPALLAGLLKNGVGLLLCVLGVVMLVTPGQGLLTLMAGLLLMNFPGKYRLEQALVRRPAVLRALNWIRSRSGRPPFEAPTV